MWSNATADMTEREAILARVREALTVEAPRPRAHGAGAAPHAAASAFKPGAARQWLPAVGNTFEERVALFRANSAELKTDFRLLDHKEELAKTLLELRETGQWQRIASHNGELARAACKALGLPVCWTEGGYDVRELEQCNAGVTECDALIAQTGSVLVTSRSAGGRALSVLPPHHVVVARREQLLADLPAAFELLKRKYAADYPSFISLITGPSRTGDIERILVLGAHGPKKLTVVCVKR
jgi:L-lactate dehydrogenase complex protein LldG